MSADSGLAGAGSAFARTGSAFASFVSGFSAAGSAFAHPNSTLSEVETDGENPQHNGVLRAFADAILHGGKLVADGREGIFGLTVSNAMHLSAWLGHEVEIPFDEALFRDELMKRAASSRRKGTVTEVTSNTDGTY